MACSWPVARLSCTAKGAARGFLRSRPQFVVADTVTPLAPAKGQKSQPFVPQGSDFQPPIVSPPAPFVPVSSTSGMATQAFEHHPTCAASTCHTSRVTRYLFHHTVPPRLLPSPSSGWTLSLCWQLPFFRCWGKMPPTGALCPRSIVNSSITSSDVAFISRSSLPSLSLS